MTIGRPPWQYPVLTKRMKGFTASASQRKTATTSKALMCSLEVGTGFCCVFSGGTNVVTNGTMANALSWASKDWHPIPTRPWNSLNELGSVACAPPGLPRKSVARIK